MFTQANSHENTSCKIKRLSSISKRCIFTLLFLFFPLFPSNIRYNNFFMVDLKYKTNVLSMLSIVKVWEDLYNSVIQRSVCNNIKL